MAYVEPKTPSQIKADDLARRFVARSTELHVLVESITTYRAGESHGHETVLRGWYIDKKLATAALKSIRIECAPEHDEDDEGPYRIGRTYALQTVAIGSVIDATSAHQLCEAISVAFAEMAQHLKGNS